MSMWHMKWTGREEYIKFRFSSSTTKGNMMKFIHLFKNYDLGISFIGIAAFVIQEIPYIVMPLINLHQIRL